MSRMTSNKDEAFVITIGSLRLLMTQPNISIDQSQVEYY